MCIKFSLRIDNVFTGLAGTFVANGTLSRMRSMIKCAGIYNIYPIDCKSPGVFFRAFFIFLNREQFNPWSNALFFYGVKQQTISFLLDSSKTY